MTGQWFSTRCRLWGWTVAGLLGAACAADDDKAKLPAPQEDPERASDAGSESVSFAKCPPGAVRECYRTLGEHNGVTSCFEGIQICDDAGTWGLCSAGDITTRVAPEHEPDTDLLAVTGARGCTNNPCDPDCRFFGSSGDGVPTLEIPLSEFPWETGSLGDLPADWVAEGARQPCATGADCQFNTTCRAPASGGCEHSKCETGAALSSSCDPCVSEICAVNPECCAGEEITACQHGLCAHGVALKASCDPCVAQICDSFPACCDLEHGAWDESCIAEVTHTCGRECSCCEGEALRDGRCYFVDIDTRDWDGAHVACQLRGPGWDLVAISDADENAFVSNLALNETTWIGITDGKGVGVARHWQWPGEDGVWNQDSHSGMYDNFYEKPNPCSSSSDPHGCTRNTEPGDHEDCAHLRKSTGNWYGHDCAAEYNALCEGPQLCGDGALLGLSCELVLADSCEHDLCTIGVALKPECDECAQAVCQADSSCCEAGGAWTERCVGLVASECSVSCTCGEGELAFGGHCYHLEAYADATWPGARAACQARGSGWELVSVADQAENDFVQSLLLEDDAWIGLTEGNGVGSTDNWRWSNGSPDATWNESTGGTYEAFVGAEPNPDEQCARLRPDGGWYGNTCTHLAAYICEGPASTLGAVTPPSAAGEWSCGVNASSPATGIGAEGGWSEQCVERVATTCDARCVDGDESTTGGSCAPWYPGQTDDTCVAVDLAVGVPCDESVPVCNHGNAEAPAGVRLLHFPRGSVEFGSCTPDTSHADARECFTEQPIPPGHCINVSDCPGLTEAREVIVNPPGADHLDECSCKDNWSIFQPGVECGPPTCSGGTNSAAVKRRPIDVIVSIDNSMSMQAEIQSVQRRINDDLAQIIQDSGIDYRVIMVSRYGNVHIRRQDGGDDFTSSYSVCIGEPLSSLNCPIDASDSTPKLAHNEPRFYHHSTDVGSRDMFCKLLDSFHTSDPLPSTRAGWTPIAPNGWGEFLRPEALKIFVAVTDDAPGLDTGGTQGNCDSATGFSDDVTGAEAFDRALRQLAPEQFGAYDAAAPSVGRNYVWYSIVGMAGNDESHPTPLEPDEPIESLCCRGDGDAVACPVNSMAAPLSDGVRSGLAYQELSRMTGGLRYPICYSANFDDMFHAIATKVVESARVSCDFELLNTGSFDIRSAEVLFRSDDVEQPMVFSQVPGVEDCGLYNWYIPGGDPANGLTLCPSACATVQGVPNGRLSLEVGCAGSELDPYDFAQVYQGECSFDEAVQWGFFSVDALTPADSDIVVSARAAPTEEELAETPFVELVTLSAAQGNSQCSSPDVAGCPVSLFEALAGIPAARYPFIELSARFNPTSDGSQLPIVQNWRLTYSCPDSQ